MPEPTVLKPRAGTGTEPTNGHLQGDTIAAAAVLAEVTPPPQNSHKESLRLEPSLPLEEQLQALNIEYASALNDPNSNGRANEALELLTTLSGNPELVRNYANSLSRYYSVEDPTLREEAHREYLKSLHEIRDLAERRDKGLKDIDPGFNMGAPIIESSNGTYPTPASQADDTPSDSAMVAQAAPPNDSRSNPLTTETSSEDGRTPPPTSNRHTIRNGTGRFISTEEATRLWLSPTGNRAQERTEPDQEVIAQTDTAENHTSDRTPEPWETREEPEAPTARPASSSQPWLTQTEDYHSESVEDRIIPGFEDEGIVDPNVPEQSTAETVSSGSLDLPAPEDSGQVIEQPELNVNSLSLPEYPVGTNTNERLGEGASEQFSEEQTTINEIRKHLLLITTSEAAFIDRSRDLAEKQVGAELNLRKIDLLSPKKVLRMIATRFNESGRRRHYEARALNLLVSTGNAYADIDLSRKSAKDAIVDPHANRAKFQSEVRHTMEAMELNPELAAKSMTPAEISIRTKLMESIIRPALSNTDLTPEEIQISINELIRDNRSDFNSVFGESSTSSEALSVFLSTNIAEKIEFMREDMRVHNRSVEDMDQWIDLQMATPRWGAQTEYVKTWLDKVTAWGEKGRFKTAKRIMLQPSTVAVATSLAIAGALSQGKWVASQAILHPIMTFVGGGIAGGLMAGVRRYHELKQDRLRHQREMARGEDYTEKYQPDDPKIEPRVRRKALDRYSYDPVSAERLINGTEDDPGLAKLIGSDLTNADNQNLLLHLLAETHSRMKVSLDDKVDLITYSKYDSTQAENLNMLKLYSLGVMALRDSGVWTYDMEARLHQMQEDYAKDFRELIAERDKDFEGFRREEAGREAVKGFGIGFAASAIAGFMVIPKLREVASFAAELFRANGLDLSKITSSISDGAQTLMAAIRPGFDSPGVSGGFEIPKPPEDLGSEINQPTRTETNNLTNRPDFYDGSNLQASINSENISVDQTSDNITQQSRDVLGKGGVWREAAVDITDKTWDGRQSDEFFVGKKGDSVILKIPDNADGVLISRGEGNPIWIPKDGDGLVRLDPDSDRTFRSLRGEVVHMDDLAKMLINQDELAKYDNGSLRTEEFTDRRDVLNAQTIEAAKLHRTDGGLKASIKATILGDGQLPDQIITDNIKSETTPPENPPVDQPGEIPNPNETPSPMEEPTSPPERTPLPEVTPAPTLEATPLPESTTTPTVPEPTHSPSTTPSIKPEPTESVSPSPIVVEPDATPVPEPTINTSPIETAAPTAEPTSPPQPNPSPVLNSEPPAQTPGTPESSQKQDSTNNPLIIDADPTPFNENYRDPTLGGDPPPKPQEGDILAHMAIKPDTLPKVASVVFTPRYPLEKTFTDFDHAYEERFKEEQAKAASEGLEYDYPKDRPVELGWQLHLNVDPGTELGKRVREAALSWRLKSSDNLGKDAKEKGMTIFIGDRNTAVDFAVELNKAYGHLIMPPTETMRYQDVQIAGNIGGRFVFPNQRIDDVKFDSKGFGRGGITYIDDDAVRLAYKMAPNNQSGFIYAAMRAAAVLKGTYGAFYEGTGDRQFKIPASDIGILEETIRYFRKLPADFQKILDRSTRPISQNPEVKKSGLLNRFRRNSQTPSYVVNPQPVGLSGGMVTNAVPGPISYTDDDENVI